MTSIASSIFVALVNFLFRLIMPALCRL